MLVQRPDLVLLGGRCPRLTHSHNLGEAAHSTGRVYVLLELLELIILFILCCVGVAPEVLGTRL